MKIFSVLKKDLRVLLRDRGQLATLFLMPLAFILPISFALGAGDGYGVNRANNKERLPVLDYDGGFRATEMIETLGDSLQIEQDMGAEEIENYDLTENPVCVQSGLACDKAVFEAMLARSHRTLMLEIPEGFTDAIEAGEHTTLTVIYDPVSQLEDRQQLEGIIRGQATKLSLTHLQEEALGQFGTLTTYAPDEVRDSVAEAADTPAEADQQAALRMETIFPSNYTLETTPDTFQQTIPGYTVMFVFFLIAYLNSSLRQERVLGTFRRLMSVPVDRGALLGGKLLNAFLVGVIQVGVMFTVGNLIFGLDLGSDWLALILLTFALVASATALGLVAAAVGLADNALTAPLIAAAVLSGCILPLDLLPSFVRTISNIFPHRWALAGYQNLMVRGQALPQVMPQILVLVGFTAVFFFIAVRRFDFED